MKWPTARARILVQVTIYCRLRIGQDEPIIYRNLYEETAPQMVTQAPGSRSHIYSPAYRVHLTYTTEEGAGVVFMP